MIEFFSLSQNQQGGFMWQLQPSHSFWFFRNWMNHSLDILYIGGKVRKWIWTVFCQLSCRTRPVTAAWCIRVFQALLWLPVWDSGSLALEFSWSYYLIFVKNILKSDSSESSHEIFLVSQSDSISAQTSRTVFSKCDDGWYRYKAQSWSLMNQIVSSVLILKLLIRVNSDWNHGVGSSRYLIETVFMVEKLWSTESILIFCWK